MVRNDACIVLALERDSYGLNEVVIYESSYVEGFFRKVFPEIVHRLTLYAIVKLAIFGLGNPFVATGFPYIC
jgi:hypothetical protein